jgi:hypothetical protein
MEQAIENQEQLIKFLKEELGYCNCASGYAWQILYDALHIIHQRSEALHDINTFSQKTRELTALLQLNESLGLGEWFVYFLEDKQLISHGFNSSDCWITEKGKQLLQAITQFSPVHLHLT